MIQFAKTFPDEKIVVSLMRQLSWTHILVLIPIEDSLKRSFYIEMCKLEQSNIKVAEYLTKLPDMKLLENKLHQAIERAKSRMSLK